MARCTKTYFSREILCAGSMMDLITIQKREVVGTRAGRTQATESFTKIRDYMGRIEPVSPTKRFDGVSVDGEFGGKLSGTHIVYIPFDQDVYELDTNSLFVKLDRTRPKLYKMIKIEDVGEQEEYLALHCKEQGFADLEANEA